MNRMHRAVVLFAAAALAFSACRKPTPVKGVELDVKFGEATLTDNLITDVTYTWKTGDDFVPMDRDYNVFVHFWHNSNMIVQDDHVPDVPTSKWTKGNTYVVKRRLFIPEFIDVFDPMFKGEETLRMTVGFANPFDRTGNGQKEVLVRKLKVVPPPPNTPEVIYESGWYDKEVNRDSPLKEWRWTAKEGKCVIDNPHRDAVLVIRGAALVEAITDQKISFLINDLPLDQFVAEAGLFDKTYAIKKEMLGDKDEFTLTIAVDKPFIPAKAIPDSKDERELGIQVSLVYFR